MATPSPRRGLQIMRTQSTRKANSNLSSPELYLRLTSLEMERARRVMERDRLLERMRILDERIGKIAEEQAQMRARLDQAHANQSLERGDAGDDRDASQGPQFGFTY